MTVLVTGATGRIGSRLVPRLLEHREAVRVIAREPSRAEALRERGAEVVKGDLREPADLARALDGTRSVIHLAAAFRGVPDEEAVAVNERATIALGRACVEAGIARFVFASTNLIYGPGRGRPAREADEPGPDGAYGVYPRTKAAAERALRDLHRDSGLDLRVLASPSSTARAIRTSASRCAGRATGRGTSACTWSTTPTSRRRSSARCAQTGSTARRSTWPTMPRSARSSCSSSTARR
jgi:nucleoside-diphosphate-sugar epimerase